MKQIKDFIIERGLAPNVDLSKKKVLNSNPAINMIQTILDELIKEHPDCKYDSNKNAWVGKDADLWKGANQFLFDYMYELDQKDFEEIVKHFGWEKFIPDINDIQPEEIAMCVSLILNSSKQKEN